MIDYDPLYRSEFGAFQDGMRLPGDRRRPPAMRLDAVPWDIGEAQPAVRAIEAGGDLESEILDVGSGLGHNALYLAERGHHVLGVDCSAVAVDRAREQRAGRDLAGSAEFEVADATDLRHHDGRFRTALDSALYHCLTKSQRRAYVDGLAAACMPGARLHLLCFSDRLPRSLPGAYRVSESNIRGTLAASGWTLRTLEHATYCMSFTREALRRNTDPALLAAIEDAGIGYDDHDRLQAPIWLASAELR